MPEQRPRLVPVMVEYTDPDASLADGEMSEWEAHDAASAAAIAEMAKRRSVAKGLSPASTGKRSRTAQLVGRLKRRRNYRKPVRGGTGAQARTRRRSF